MCATTKTLFVLVLAATIAHSCTLTKRPKRFISTDLTSSPIPNYASGGVCNGAFEEASEILVKRVANCIYTGAIDIQFDSCCDPIFLRLVKNGIYPVRGELRYCDMETDGGGWLVIQRRDGGKRSFKKYWRQYKNGFGVVDRDFWIGLLTIQQFTQRTTAELRVDMKLANGTSIFAKYGFFYITHEDNQFMVRVGHYAEESTAGDGLGSMDGGRFSTSDKDYDYRGNRLSDCSDDHESGWWFNDDCNVTDLNGPYFDPDTKDPMGVRWIAPDSPFGSDVRVFSVEMKIRPRKWECGNNSGREATSNLVRQQYVRPDAEDQNEA